MLMNKNFENGQMFMLIDLSLPFHRGRNGYCYTTACFKIIPNIKIPRLITRTGSRVVHNIALQKSTYPYHKKQLCIPFVHLASS